MMAEVVIGRKALPEVDFAYFLFLVCGVCNFFIV